MGAITGVIADDGNPLDPTLAERLIAAAPVRGFDGISVWQDGPACLIRHHHATTPQAVGETQPLVSQGGRLVAMLDGRIDNRPDVIATLARADCRDETPDVALVLALFERFGEECVTRLVGDWALAVWNTTDRSLFLARSPLGWRPLIWSHAGGRFGFATDARTLLRGLGLDHSPNEGVVGELLATHIVTRTETLWRSINQLEQGCAMRVADGTTRFWRWHSVPHSIDETLSDADHIDRFNAAFDQAVIAMTRSNTTVSAHLSGGLDSSSVVTRAITLHRAGRIAQPVQAISGRFPGLPHDETRWSSAVEDKLGITARVTGRDRYSFAQAHRWVADSYQLPIRPSVFDGGFGSYRLLEAEGGRVLLTGEGGDEWMNSGVSYLADLLRQGRLGALVREGLRQYPGDPLWRRLARTAYWSAGAQVSARHRQRIALSHLGGNAGSIGAWVRSDWAASSGLRERVRTAQPSAVLPSFVQQHRYTNIDMPPRFFLIGGIHALAERHGVELRHPFHDQRLAQFFMTAAPRMLRRDGLRKYILREAMRGTLAESVRTRRDKAMFLDSMTNAILDHVRDRPVDALLPVARGWVDRDVVTTMIEAVRAGRRDVRIGPLWSLVALDVWLAEATG